MAERAPLPPPPYPTLRALIEARAAELGPRPFATLPDATLTYAEIDELANRVAAVLLSMGYGAGDVVMVRSGNGWAPVAVWFACAKLGAVYLPLNALLTGEPLRQVMADSRGRVVVVAHQLADDVEAVRGGLPDLCDVLVVGGRRGCVPGPPRLDELVERAPSGPPPPLADCPGAPAKLMYTSGTTGVPKGVLWSRHCEAVWAWAYGEELLPIEAGEGLYCCLPLFHVTSQATVLAALSRRGRVTIDAGFDVVRFWRRVREADAAMFTFVGTVLSALARRPPSPGDADNPVRRALGAATPVDRWREIEERFDLHVAETWGQTETASCWSWPARGLPQKTGTVGVPSDRWDASVRGPGGQELGPGEPGELWVRPRAAHVMFEGYLGPDGPGRPTRECFDDDGWYQTGDVMAFDGDGQLCFAGRWRDAIRRAGEMIAPSFIEEAALRHPAVVEAAAVGVPALDGVEEEVLLCVVADPGVPGGVDLDDLAAHLGRLLPRHLVPRWLRAHDELPKTPTTRVRKFELRALGTAGAWDARRRRWAGGPGPSGPQGPPVAGG